MKLFCSVQLLLAFLGVLFVNCDSFAFATYEGERRSFVMSLVSLTDLACFQCLLTVFDCPSNNSRIVLRLYGFSIFSLSPLKKILLHFT